MMFPSIVPFHLRGSATHPRTWLLLTLTLLVPFAATAQSLPWVGLTSHGALAFQEATLAGHGPGAYDHFGFATVAGDFNGDGYDDLAVGAPHNDCGSVINCGVVQVRFGWSVGALGAVLVLDPAAPGAPDQAEKDAYYGSALAVGDFNGDGRDDLAVGAPGDRDGDELAAGAVQIHYGLPGELGSIQWVAEHLLHQDVPGVPGDDYHFEYFGSSLASGDFNGDGHDDLAIGTPRNRFPADVPSGNVVVAHGHIGGLIPFGGFEMRLGLQGLPDTPEDGEAFGDALAAGDFNGDGYDDLAIGVPEEDGVGAVLVVYGSANSLIFANHWYFGQWDLNQHNNLGSRFGKALAAGDFDGDGYDDLAIGEPLFDANSTLVDIGMVALVYGSSGGLTPVGHQFLWEDSLYNGVNSEAGDAFGSALVAGDFNGDGLDDLAIGTPGEDDVAVDSGAVTVVLGKRTRGLGPGRRLRSGDPLRTLIPDFGVDTTGLGARYGAALAAGDFDGNGFDDLAIGASTRNAGSDPIDAGAVAVIFGLLFRDGFETGDVGFWSGWGL